MYGRAHWPNSNITTHCIFVHFIHSICSTILLASYQCLDYWFTCIIHSFIHIWSHNSGFQKNYAIGLPEGYIRGGMVRPYSENQYFRKVRKHHNFAISVHQWVSKNSLYYFWLEKIQSSNIRCLYVHQHTLNFTTKYQDFLKN